MMQFFHVSGRLHIQSPSENSDSVFETTQLAALAIRGPGAKIPQSLVISRSNLEISDPIGQGKT